MKKFELTSEFITNILEQSYSASRHLWSSEM